MPISSSIRLSVRSVIGGWQSTRSRVSLSGSPFGSITGSFVAAALLGISDVAGKYYVPAIGAFLIYFVMIVLLMWRPRGLFGRR